MRRVGPLHRGAMALFGEAVILRYLAQRFAGSFLMLFIGISLVLQALNLLAESGDILAGDGASGLSLIRYIYLNWPQLATQLPPFVSLLAALITFAALNQRSEIIVMKASGMSPFHIVRPLVMAGALVAVAHFLFNEFVVVPTTEELRQWQAQDYAMGESGMPPTPTDTWAMEDGTMIRVRSVTRNGTILDDVTLYRQDADGLMSQVVNADFAAHVDDRWTLFDVSTFDVANHTVTSKAEMAWSTALPPERFLALSLQRDTISFFELAGTIGDLDREGQPTNQLTAWLHQKLAGPAAAAIMPLLGAVAAFGVFRGGLLFVRITAGAILGFTYFVVDNLLLALGQFGSLPPPLAAWAPVALFLCIGIGIIVYAEE